MTLRYASQPDEAPLRRDVDPVLQIPAKLVATHLRAFGGHHLVALLQVFRKRIGHRPQLDLAVGVHRLHGGTRAASAASDQRNLQFFVTRRLGRQLRCDQGAAHRRGSRAGDELSSVQGIVVHVWERT